MDLSERNKKVAISRWKKIHAREKEGILQDKDSLFARAAICGFLAGDGSFQKRKEKSFFHYQIDFFPDDKSMKDVYISKIKEVYNKIPFTTNDKNFYSVRISSKTIYEDLSKYAKFGLKSWTLPKDLFESPGSKENWIRAFFSAEAYVNKKWIRVQTINKLGMGEISKTLNELGILHRRYEYYPRKKSESPVFIINIARRESRLKFYNTIGFWHEKKNKILKESLGL